MNIINPLSLWESSEGVLYGVLSIFDDGTISVFNIDRLGCIETINSEILVENIAQFYSINLMGDYMNYLVEKRKR